MLDQDQKLQMKELFNLYAENASLSKTTLFISCYIVQKRQRRAALHTFLLFFSTWVPCQARRTFRTKKGKTHPIPTIANISSQSILACGATGYPIKAKSKVEATSTAGRAIYKIKPKSVTSARIAMPLK